MDKWIWVVLVLVGVWYFAGDGLQGVTTDGGEQDPIVIDAGCGKTTATLYVNAYNKFAEGTALSSTDHRVFASGADRGKVDDGSSMTVDPDDELVIYAGRNDTFGTSGQSYYAQKSYQSQ